jgi:hypothetical protein
MIIPPQLALYATQVWFKVAAVALIVLAIFVGGYHFGSKSTQAEWDKQIAVQTQERLAAEQSARKEEQRRAEESRRVVDELAQREAVSRTRAAAAERTVVSLRNEVARLNARPAPGNAEAAGYANEARVARELLGACGKEYGDLAAEADGLRDQVTGLQDWVVHVTQ